MAEVNVGKGCECIYSFEKHYVDFALSKLIDSTKEQIAKIEKDIEEFGGKGGSPALIESMKGGIPLVKNVLHEYEVVRERFQAMPTC